MPEEISNQTKSDKKVTKATKVKRKRWIHVLASKLFRNEPIGEIPTAEPELLKGKLVTVSLMTLTRDMKKQNTNVKFIITNIQGDRANTELYGYYLNPTSIKRLVRRGKEKIGVSAIFKTSDNKKVRMMPLVIPRTKVKGSIATSFKRLAINYLTAYTAKTTFENIVRDLITNKLQRELKNELKKAYPVRILEVAKLHIEREKKPAEEKKVEEIKEEKPKKEEKPEKKEEEKKEKPVKEEKTEKKEEPKEEKKEEKETPKEEPKK